MVVGWYYHNGKGAYILERHDDIIWYESIHDCDIARPVIGDIDVRTGEMSGNCLIRMGKEKYYIYRFEVGKPKKLFKMYSLLEGNYIREVTLDFDTNKYKSYVDKPKRDDQVFGKVVYDIFRQLQKEDGSKES